MVLFGTVGTENAKHAARVKEIALFKNRKCLWGCAGFLC
jgi:hypothetical protein